MTPEQKARELIAQHVAAGKLIADEEGLYAALVEALKEAAGRGLHRMGPACAPDGATAGKPGGALAEEGDLSWPHQEANP